MLIDREVLIWYTIGHYIYDNRYRIMELFYLKIKRLDVIFVKNEYSTITNGFIEN